LPRRVLNALPRRAERHAAKSTPGTMEGHPSRARDDRAEKYPRVEKAIKKV